MKKITFLFFLMCAALSFGQSLPVDFEDGTTTPAFAFGGVGFGNVANPDVQAPNTSSRVLEVNKPETADWFGGFGFQTTGAPLIDFNLGTEITFKFWTPIPNLPLRVRVQADLDAGANEAYDFDTVVTTANAWQEITIDFAGIPGVDGNEQFQEFVIFPFYDPACVGADPACTTVGTGNGALYYVDDVAQTITFDPDADASLSDLTLDGVTIDGFNSGVTNYSVGLVNGTTTAPTVAGVATQAGNGSSNVVVMQAGGVPGTATLDVTAPNGVDTETYTVNFFELPPAAPVPSLQPNEVIPVITNNPAYTDIGVNFLEPFGSIAEELDLDVNGSPDTFTFNGGNGGQLNYFAGSNFFDITAAGVFHFDFYAETLNAGDNLNVILFGSDPGTQNQNFRVFVDETQTGVWQSFEIGLNGAGSGLPDEFNGTANTAFSQLALIQFITGEVGSTLPGTTIYIGNVYFRGGTLSTPDVELGNSFAVAPNPSNDVWNIKAANNQNVTSIVVYDMLGKQVLSLEPNTNEVTLNAADLKSGIYLAKLATANGSKTIKLVKN
ncbi:T9SS type A sorting domain-containing protein [uncultured Winogradskyella sp.]|uniref:T9SS type A sorting domain-containing protein n=1 Tax=uncultured Winogradskyella sp. TaxID=395353 RepID=UPI0035176368